MSKFKVWCEELGSTEDDARTFEASDHDDAARAWARYYDAHSADYLIVTQKWEPIVCVLGPDETTPQRRRVTGETVPSYTAYRTP